MEFNAIQYVQRVKRKHQRWMNENENKNKNQKTSQFFNSFLFYTCIKNFDFFLGEDLSNLNNE